MAYQKPQNPWVDLLNLRDTADWDRWYGWHSHEGATDEQCLEMIESDLRNIALDDPEEKSHAYSVAREKLYYLKKIYTRNIERNSPPKPPSFPPQAGTYEIFHGNPGAPDWEKAETARSVELDEVEAYPLEYFQGDYKLNSVIVSQLLELRGVNTRNFRLDDADKMTMREAQQLLLCDKDGWVYTEDSMPARSIFAEILTSANQTVESRWVAEKKAFYADGPNGIRSFPPAKVMKWRAVVP